MQWRRRLPWLLATSLLTLLSEQGRGVAGQSGSVGNLSIQAWDGPSLAVAINQANADSDLDTIQLAAGTYVLDDSFTWGNVGSSLPTIRTPMRIVGAGRDVTILTRPENAIPLRLLFVDSGAQLTIEDVTLEGGHADDFNGGGGILAYGRLVVRRSAFSRNDAGSTFNSNGGAIRANSVGLTVSDSQFTNNKAPAAFGGAIDSFSVPWLPLDITGSEFTSNAADYGGAVAERSNFPAASSGRIADSLFRDNTATEKGGALWAGAITLERVTVTDNRVFSPGATGAGLFIDGVNVIDSAVDGNHAPEGTGGGIATVPSSAARPVSVTGTTISNNVAKFGGGVYAGGPITLTNATISGNRASTDGAGIYAGTATLQNVTVTGNEAGHRGGGVALPGFGAMSLQNTLVAGNTDTDGVPDCFSGAIAIQSVGHNLFGNIGWCNYVAGDGDLIGTPDASIDARLGPLQDNDGPTLTHLPLSDSPALEAGSALTPGSDTSACEPADQRGVARPQGARCDIGAVEVTHHPPTIVAAFFTTAEDTPVELALTVSHDDGDDPAVNVVTGPAHGTLSGTFPHLLYTPTANFFGEDAVTVIASTPFSDSGPVDIRITVTLVNDPPTAVDDAATLDHWDTPLHIDVLANDSDAPDSGESLAVVAVTSGTYGTVAIGPGATDVVYTASAAYSGSDSFTYTVGDGNGGTATASVTVTVTAPPAIVLEINEHIGVVDTPSVVPALMLHVEEQVAVSDTQAIAPAVMLSIDEHVGVIDTSGVTPLAPVVIDITETIGVTDTPSTLPAVMLAIAESIGVSDQPTIEPQPVNTPPGTNVVVHPVDTGGVSPVVLTLATVTTGGITTLKLGSFGPPPPPGFEEPSPALTFDLATTASFTGLAHVCVDYSGHSFPTTDIQLLHAEGGVWVDHTVSINSTTHTVCADVPSLSPFAVMARTVEGRMTGNGTITSNGADYEFTFNIVERAIASERGRLQLLVIAPRSGRTRERKDRFESTDIGPIAFWNDPIASPGRPKQVDADTATFSGVGTWNGTVGYRFEARAADEGEPGRGHDTFSITIRDAAGTVVAMANGTLTNGNIQSLRLPGRK